MPFYLTQSRLSADAWKALVAAPEDRTEAVRRVVEAAGGKLHHYFFGFGEHDVYVLAEMPDNISEAAAALVVAGSGSVVSNKTTVLMTTGEMVEAMRKAGEITGTYRPPG